MNDRFYRMVLFGVVYFVEGALLTYFTVYNVIYLRTFELSFTRIGIMSGIALVPFVLKIIIGLLSDRFSLFGLGHRKPYIVLGLLLQSIGFISLPFISPVNNFAPFVIAFSLAALGMSTYDTCTDGLSIDVTPENERGLVQGIMVGGRALSSVVMAAAFGFLSENGMWFTVFALVSALGLVTIPLALVVKESAERPPEKEFSKEAFRSLFNTAFLFFIILGFIYPLALYGANGMISAFLNEILDIKLGQVGLYMSVFGIGAVVGAVFGGPLMKIIGRRASILSALLLTAVVTALLAITPSPTIAWVAVALFGIAFGYYETVFLAMGMDFSDPRIAAFMFSIIMALGNLGIGMGQPLAGAMVDSIGFRGMFSVFAGINLIALPFIFGIFHLRKDLK